MNDVVKTGGSRQQPLMKLSAKQARRVRVAAVQAPIAWATRHLAAHHRRESPEVLAECYARLEGALNAFRRRCMGAYHLDVPLIAAAVVRQLGHNYVLDSGFADILRDAAQMDREAEAKALNGGAA